jgi:site-specific DNA recombinase
MPNQKTELIAAGISRVSLLLQVDNYSLEAQRHKFASLSEKYGCRIPEEFLIEDEGYSGSDFNRPSIRKALDWIYEGKINAVAFPYLDRFARNLEGGLNLIRTFREAGAEVLLGDYGWYDARFKSTVQLGLMMAEQQKDSIVEKSKGGVEAKVRSGLAHGGSPFGWRFVTAAELNYRAMEAGLAPAKRPANVHEPVPEDQATYRLMGDLALSGHGLRAIARELSLRGIKSPRGKSRWNAWTVANILNDTSQYTGIWHYGKREGVMPKKLRKPGLDRHRVKSSWKKRPHSEWTPQNLPGGPIVSQDRWQAVQDALERNGRTGVGKPAAEGGYEAILKSLIVCAACGKAVAPKQRSTPAGRRCWYLCTYHDRLTGQALCGERAVKAEILEEAVWNGMVEGLTGKLEQLVREHREAIVAENTTAEMSQLRALEKKLVGKMQQAIDGALDADDADEKRRYSERVTDFKGQLKMLRRRIASFTAEADAVEVDCPSVSRAVRAACRTRVRSERREVLVEFVQQVRFSQTAGEAELILRVPLAGANRQNDVHAFDNYILLKTKVRAA